MPVPYKPGIHREEVQALGDESVNHISGAADEKFFESPRMGNGCVKGSNGRGGAGKPTIKVILADGTDEEFFKSITAAELMMEYPQHFVFHSSAGGLGNNLHKKAILPADEELEPGRLYYLLPSSKFSGPLSTPLEPDQDPAMAMAKKEEHTRFDNIADWKPRPGTRDDMEVGADSDEKDDEPIVSYSTPDLRSMYLAAAGNQANLLRCNSWKPRLETIHEVGAFSRKRFQNFVRGRGSLSQVHSYRST